jgi:endo-beta-N-acetylglucosaminidase D
MATIKKVYNKFVSYGFNGWRVKAETEGLLRQKIEVLRDMARQGKERRCHLPTTTERTG